MLLLVVSTYDQPIAGPEFEIGTQNFRSRHGHRKNGCALASGLQSLKTKQRLLIAGCRDKGQSAVCAPPSISRVTRMLLRKSDDKTQAEAK